MKANKHSKYTTEFKQTIVNLHHLGKSYDEIRREYGAAHSSLARWKKQFSKAKIGDDAVSTTQQIKALKKRNAQLQEENFILRKAIEIIVTTPIKDYKL